MSRFPRRLIEELGDDHPRRLLESARADAPPAKLVAAAIATASRSARASGGTPGGRRGMRLLTRNKVLLAAGGLILGGMLAWSTTRDPRAAAPGEPLPTATLVATGTSPTGASPTGLTPAPEGDRIAVTSVTDLPDAPAAAPSPLAAAAALAQAPSAAVTTSRRIAALPAAPPGEHSAGPESRTPTAAPADLLREANRLRAEAKWAEAAATYQRVLDGGAGSPEAYPAEVALGNLELQQGRADAALARYEHALVVHPRGALAEESRWGRVRALRAAGRVAEERAALEEFRLRHPESPLVPAAERRLAEIGP